MQLTAQVTTYKFRTTVHMNTYVRVLENAMLASVKIVDDHRAWEMSRCAGNEQEAAARAQWEEIGQPADLIAGGEPKFRPD